MPSIGQGSISSSILPKGVTVGNEMYNTVRHVQSMDKVGSKYACFTEKIGPGKNLKLPRRKKVNRNRKSLTYLTDR